MLKTSEKFYNDKDYPNAILVLENHKKELSPGLWHYNMGSIMARMEKLPEARFHLIMASQNGFNSDNLLHNQQLVEEKLDIIRLEKPLSTKDYLVKSSLILSGGILSSLSLVILVVGLWILRKKADLKKILLFLVLVLVPIALNLWITTWSKAIVTFPQLISEGPSSIFETKSELPAGVMIIFSGEGDWRKIIYPSRFQGWVKSKDLMELE